MAFWVCLSYLLIASTVLTKRGSQAPPRMVYDGFGLVLTGLLIVFWACTLCGTIWYMP